METEPSQSVPARDPIILLTPDGTAREHSEQAEDSMGDDAEDGEDWDTQSFGEWCEEQFDDYERWD